MTINYTERERVLAESTPYFDEIVAIKVAAQEAAWKKGDELDVPAWVVALALGWDPK